MIETKYFINYFPLDKNKIQLMNNAEIKKLISHINDFLLETDYFNNKKKYFRNGNLVRVNVDVVKNKIISGEFSELNENDIKFINQSLYLWKYKFPISFFITPILKLN